MLRNRYKLKGSTISIEKVLSRNVGMLGCRTFVVILTLLLLIIGNLEWNGGGKRVSIGDAAAAELSVFEEVFELIEKHYVEEVDPRQLAFGAIEGMAKDLADHNGVESPKPPARPNPQNKTQAIANVHEVVDHYIRETNVQPKILEEGAIKGMIATLDPHSSFLTVEMYKEMQVETKGEFGGLGIQVGMKENGLMVITPIEDTPAFEAGIEAGDLILKIDGEATKGLTLMEAVSRMRGRKGTQVELTIGREGVSDPLEFTITRATIKIRSVRAKVLENRVGYIRISQFQQSTPKDIGRALQDLEQDNIRALVLDLRNNPGGLLTATVGVAERFLDPESLVAILKDREGRTHEYRTDEDADSPDNYPMIILVNQGTAAGTEILAGALQDSKTALIMGTETFGKGTVQTIFPLQDGSGLRLTTALYYRPTQRLIRDKIQPDVIVKQNKKDKGNDLPLRVAEQTLRQDRYGVIPRLPSRLMVRAQETLNVLERERRKTSPRIEITSHDMTKSHEVSSETLRVVIQGTVEDPSDITEVAISGKKVEVDSGGRFAGEVALVEGENLIIVAATDQFGNVTRQNMTIHRAKGVAEGHPARAPSSRSTDTTPPQIVINYPENQTHIQEEQVLLVGLVTDNEGVSSVDIIINGTPLPGIRDISVASNQPALTETTRTLSLSVSIPLRLGSNLIVVNVSDAAGNISQEVRSVTRDRTTVITTTKEFRGQRWAVVIGISQYQYGHKGITNLRYADRDAEAFYNFLKSPQGGSFTDDHIMFLRNEEATYARVRTAFFDFLKGPIREDLVIIYYAGHGTPDPTRPENMFLLTYDSNPEMLAATAFPMWDMETALKRFIQAERVVVLTDACHSAGVGTSTGMRAGAAQNNLVNRYLQELSESGKGRAIFTASETGEYSQESERWGGGHGVFTHFLLEGLSGQADVDGNGVVTLGEAIDYTSEQVRRATRNAQHPATAGRFNRNLPMSVVNAP